MLTILGLLAVYLDPIIGSIDIIPDAAGYCLICIGLLISSRRLTGGIRTVSLSALALLLHILSYLPAVGPGLSILLYVLIPISELSVVFSLLALLLKQLPAERRGDWAIRAKLVQLCQSLLFLLSLFSVLFSAVLILQILSVVLQIACAGYILLTLYSLSQIRSN